MLKNIFRVTAVAALLAVVVMAGASLAPTHAYAYGAFQVCPFPSCATAPSFRVECKLNRNGPVVIRYLKDCCCGGDNWLNMYRFIR